MCITVTVIAYITALVIGLYVKQSFFDGQQILQGTTESIYKATPIHDDEILNPNTSHPGVQNIAYLEENADFIGVIREISEQQQTGNGSVVKYYRVILSKKGNYSTGDKFSVIEPIRIEKKQVYARYTTGNTSVFSQNAPNVSYYVTPEYPYNYGLMPINESKDYFVFLTRVYRPSYAVGLATEHLYQFMGSPFTRIPLGSNVNVQTITEPNHLQQYYSDAKNIDITVTSRQLKEHYLHEKDVILQRYLL